MFSAVQIQHSNIDIDYKPASSPSTIEIYFEISTSICNEFLIFIQRGIHNNIWRIPAVVFYLSKMRGIVNFLHIRKSFQSNQWMKRICLSYFNTNSLLFDDRFA